MLKLIIGNRKVLDYCLRIDGDLLGVGDAESYRLADITAGTWMVKKDPTDSNDDAVIKISFDAVTPNDVFLPDTPDTGWVRIVINSSKTQNVEPGRYYFALQLEWGVENKQEFQIGDGQVELCQDIIR